MSEGYNDTILLPKTAFPMRAGLPTREPEMLKTFFDKKIYETLIEKNKDKPKYILHDGPPFSNGDIHLGHALNKILKDMVIRYKNMSGFCAPLTPGWDNHGMPIESAIIKKNKLDRKKMTIPEFRSACHAFAADYVDRQREQFKRLGVIADWDNPYLTMSPSFEAEEVRVFGKMYDSGYIYKGFKPVYWCPSDETALAEAEIEYTDDSCTSIYVRFRIIDDKGLLSDVPNGNNASFLIWTTTAWTLPGNLAISLGPDIEYSVCSVNNEILIVASDLAENVFEKAGIAFDTVSVLKKLPGSALEFVTTQHPFYDRQSLVILGDHVTVEAGTGSVHTAPGHGVDDFNVCKKYPCLPIITPVDERGIMTDEAEQYGGQHYSKASALIIDDLKNSGALFAQEEIVHSYPHCWRCKNPIVFRATEQWFASVDALKDTAISSCHDISWIPKWGRERMIAMLIERSDWCISRQRHWGLPIPVFYCNTCSKPVCTPETIDAVANLFAKRGSNIWFEESAETLLPKAFSCPFCSSSSFEKGLDSLDCWFDSGSTHADVLSSGTFKNNTFPADLYLEGGDQYRGWFQSSMLTSIAINGVAPYKKVITHGWTVDGEGRAMHKSIGNVIAPEVVIKDYGADILRLWVASSDYKVDTKLSKDILKQLSDIYLKIRNTARFILGSFRDTEPDRFNPDALIAYDDLSGLDRWALSRLNNLIKSVISSYDNFEFHSIYHNVHNFCTIEMSSLYLDIIKDTLYCDSADSLSRRSAQSTMYIILDSLVRLLAPILAFTAEEIWQTMPHHTGVSAESVLYNQMPAPNSLYDLSEDSEDYWDNLLSLRNDVYKALEIARADKIVGKSLDAEVTLYIDDASQVGFLEGYLSFLESWLIVSKVSLVGGACTASNAHKGTEYPGVSVVVRQCTLPKCARCWKHDDAVGSNINHPDLCPRCSDVIISLGG